jgi:hypothetical protein
MIPQITFTDNPNGKLLLPVWQDCRLRDDAKYYAGASLIPVLKGNELGIVQVVAVRLFSYTKITDTFSFMNCGKHAAYQAALLQRYYQHQVKNWNSDLQLVQLVCKYTSMNMNYMETLYKDFYEKLNQQHGQRKS